jgi:YVTN family beta-propeller protein
MKSVLSACRAVLFLTAVSFAGGCEQSEPITAPQSAVGFHTVTTSLALAAPLAYVANVSSNTVSVIATATNTLVGTVAVGIAPHGVAVSPNGAFAYVTNLSSSTVSVIATATNAVAATVGVGTEPLGVAFSPDGSFAYVVNAGSNTVSVIETVSNTVVSTVPVGGYPRGVAFAPDGSFAYVVNGTSNSISVISTATHTVVATVSVGTTPLGIAITPDGAFAYVANQHGGTVSVIATASNMVVATVGVGPAATYVAVTPDGAFAYVTDNIGNTLSVIATATNTVVATIGFASSPGGVAITPDGAFAYVTFALLNSVSVIATATNAVVGTVDVGTFPIFVAITPQIGNRPPVAAIDGPYTSTEGGTVALSGYASSDADNDALTYLWDFGDGTTGAGVSISHVYAQDGSYTVRLAVTDAQGLTDTIFSTATVANVAPDIAAFAGASLLPGEQYGAASSFVDPGSDLWSATVNYGEGSGANPLSLSGKTFTLFHVYPTPGAFTVTVHVSDDDAAGTRAGTVNVISSSQGIQNAIALVNQLVADHKLNRLGGTALKVQLAVARTMVDRGRERVAVIELRAVLAQLEILVRLQHISAVDSSPLRLLLLRLIDSLT